MTQNIQEEIEDKIIDCIALGAGDRLVVFKPEKSSKDLAVEKRGDYKKRIVFLNVYSKKFSGQQDLKKETKKATEQEGFLAEKDFYLVFVYFDVIKQGIGEDLWIIPSLEIKKAVNEEDYLKYLVSKKDLGKFLIRLIEKK